MSIKPTLYIIRGLPGSGKSTLGVKLCGEGNTFAADDYFEDDTGVYNFDPTRLKDAHAWCQWAVGFALNNIARDIARAKPSPRDLLPPEASWFERLATPGQLSTVIDIAVCNTFSQQWEIDPYLAIAKEYDAIVVIIECQSDFGSTHDVPQHSIDRMRQRWEPVQA